MVDFKESRHRRVDCACDTDNVSKHKKLSKDIQLVQWCVLGSSRCPSRLNTKPPTIHHCLGSIVCRIPNWSPMGNLVSWRPSNNCWHYGWTTRQTGFMEKKNIWRPKSKHGKDQNYDLQQKPTLTQRLWKASLWCVS